MTIRFLDRVEAEIAAASTQESKNCLLAKKATYLARVGRFEEAGNIIEMLRGSRNLYHSASLPVLLTFADGTVAFYSDRIEEAKDRFVRCSALSKAVGLTKVSAFSSAWLAHLAFGRFDFHCLISELDQAFKYATYSDHECLARVCLVVAETNHLASQQEEADRWYARSRFHALQDGDESTLSSIMYNRTVMEIVNLRQRLIGKGEASVGAGIVVTGAESTENFDTLVGIVSLGHFTPVLKAQTYSLAGRYSDAEEIYSASLVETPSQAQARSRCWLLADRAYCLVRLGYRDAAISVASDVIESISGDVQVDDLAATHGRLASIFEALGDANRSSKHLAESMALWEKFAFLQRDLAERLSIYEDRYSLVSANREDTRV